MKRSNLMELIDKEREWFAVRAPEHLKKKIICGIENRIYRSVAILKWFKMISAVSLSLLAGFVIFFIITQNNPVRMVFIYHDSGVEKTVHVMGTFNKVKEKIPLILDDEKGLWKATVPASRTDLSDYEFVVEELPEEAVNTSDDVIIYDKKSPL